MLVATHVSPSLVIVDPVRMLPRFWATAWSIGLAGRSWAENTLKINLRHVDAFYAHCDKQFGQDSLDSALTDRDAASLQRMVETFYLSLLTSRGGRPLSAESIDKIFAKLSEALSSSAREQFRVRAGGKRYVSPHDLRHTCATARYSAFMAQQSDRELTLQRMRAFFGWSVNSKMPDLYAQSP